MCGSMNSKSPTVSGSKVYLLCLEVEEGGVDGGKGKRMEDVRLASVK
jgi:hypothetical protein